MKKTTKLEVYIILLALILALVTLAIFWGFNRGKSPLATNIEPALASPAKTEESNLKTNPVIPEPITVTHQGLAKLIEPTNVSALILGDSIAESSGASNQDLSSWYTLVANDLHSKYPGTIQWQFKTSSGASINDVLKNVPAVTPETDLIILCLGRSDSGRVRLTDFKQKYEQLIVDLKAQSPHADLFLVVEPPVKSNVENNKFFPYRKIILDLGQKYKIPVIDEWTSFINDPVALSSLLADNVNPNDMGYRVFADTVLKSFNDVLQFVS